MGHGSDVIFGGFLSQGCLGSFVEFFIHRLTYVSAALVIQGSASGKFPGGGGGGFKNLVHTKTQQGTYKLRKYNGHAIIHRIFQNSLINRIGFNFVLSFFLSLFYLLVLFTKFPF